MTHSDKCYIVAKYALDSMKLDDIMDYALDSLFQEIKNSDMLEDYMRDYGLTEQHLEELGGV